MALTGLQIQKLLPKTNCKECGCNTCMAFAMKLAAKKAELSACPYASDEAKRVLGAAAEPPVKALALGPDKSVKLGGETVLYRHEKTFVSPTALAINVNDTDDPAARQAVLEGVRDYVLERVGEKLTIQMVCVAHRGDRAVFVALAKEAYEVTHKPLVLRSRDADALIAAAEAVKGSGSLLASATRDTAARLVEAARANGHALAVTGADLNEVVELTTALRARGFGDLVLDFPAASRAERFQTASIARRAALKTGTKALGYPALRFITAADPLDVAAEAVDDICKYGGVTVLPIFDRAVLTALMTMRQNIFTDPQKPIQVEPKVYAIGEPTRSSPVFVTTNFSLTYFIVSGEIENSGTSAWLVIPECEGQSVLTAWAAGKFSGASIAKFCQAAGLDALVDTRQIVIPGYVSQVSGELEENLPGWKVLVGPQEAADLESFIKAKLAS